MSRVAPRSNPPPPISRQSPTAVAKGGRGWVAAAADAVAERAALAAILVLAAALDCYRLTVNGYGNIYYATAVRSMLLSAHNFFFVSFDPGGFVSVDKPPLGLWLQAISARMMGFSSLGLLLPQAIAGVVSVALLWQVVRSAFGAQVGLLAALALAVTPVSVITNRDNVLDGLLVPFLLAAAWALQRATRTGALRWLALCAVLVGLGFNVKALEAYLVLPAFSLVYLLGAPRGWRLRIAQLLLAGVVLAVVSLAWVTAVDLTPASQRPYVGSTTDDSEWSLMLGYNGLFRLTGIASGTAPSSSPSPSSSPTVTPRPHVWLAPSTHDPASGLMPLALVRAQRAAAGSPAADESAAAPPVQGEPGPWRLFQTELGGQLSWLLPLALIGLLAALRLPAWSRRLPGDWRDLLAWRLPTRQQGYALWTVWLLTAGIVFSLSRILNVYYLSVLAPAVCALAAVGMVTLWRSYLGGDWRSWLLPLAVLVTGIQQAMLLGAAPGWNLWLRPLVLVGAVALTILLIAARPSPGASRPATREDAGSATVTRGSAAGSLRALYTPSVSRAASVAAALALALLLVAPVLWTLGSLTTGNAGNWPAAGPQHALADGPYFPYADPQLMRYLGVHRGSAPFELATVDAGAAEAIILASAKPVMPMGGFTGNDPILTVNDLADLVSGGTVVYFLLPAANVTRYQLRALFPRISQSVFDAWHAHYTNTLSHWVSAHCQPLPPSIWSSEPAFTADRYPNPDELYDCSALVGKAPNPRLPVPPQGQ